MSFIAMLAFACSVQAGNATMPVSTFHASGNTDEQWKPLCGLPITNPGGGSIATDWANPENWLEGVIPSATEKAKIDRLPGPIINEVVRVKQLFVGESSGSGGPDMTFAPVDPPATLGVISGGSLDVNDRIIAGFWHNDRGTIQIDGGTVNTTHIFVGRRGHGVLIMNGGLLNVRQMFQISAQGGTGRVELNGGTIHSGQFAYEWPYDEPNAAKPTDPFYTPKGTGKATMDITGGKLIENGDQRVLDQNMVNEGKLTAFGGQGTVMIKYLPDVNQTQVTGVQMLWDSSKITVTNSSLPIDNTINGIPNMFENGAADANATVFVNGTGAYPVYFVEWRTQSKVTVNSLDAVFEQDNNLSHSRAAKHVTIRAKSPGSSTWDKILCDQNIAAPYATNVLDVNVTLASPVTAQEFRAEFTGAYAADVNGIRVRELNATGSFAETPLFNATDVTVTASSLAVVDPYDPANDFRVENMFQTGADTKSTIFMDGSGAGAIYFVEFKTLAACKVNTIEMIAEHDAASNIYQRATKHFTLKAKSLGSSTYDQVLYNADIAVPYAGNIFTLNYTLPATVTAQEFRAEFTGNDALGVRIRELNANGTKAVQLWEPGKIAIGDRSPFIVNNGQFDIQNTFQREGIPLIDPNANNTIFQDAASGVGTIYYVDFKTLSTVTVTNIQLLTNRDPVTLARGMSHFTLKAKSIGSASYDKTLYDADTALLYDVNNILNLNVTLSSAVTSRQFRAEFTGNDALGVRVTELNAAGFVTSSVTGDISDSDGDTDFKDFAVLAGNWQVDNSASLPLQTVDNFESYSAIPNSVWTNWTGQSSSNYNSMSLLTSGAHTGSKAMKWTYDLDPGNVSGDDRSGCVLTLSAPIDLKQFSKFRVWLNRHAGNSWENYLAARFYWAGKVDDSRVMAEALVTSTNGSTKTPTGWNEWVVDLKNDLVFSNGTTSADDLYNVGTIVFYVVHRPGYYGGPGQIDVDDITVAPRCSSPAGDINGDCKVDFADLSLFVQNWLAGK